MSDVPINVDIEETGADDVVEAFSQIQDSADQLSNSLDNVNSSASDSADSLSQAGDAAESAGSSMQDASDSAGSMGNGLLGTVGAAQGMSSTFMMTDSVMMRYEMSTMRVQNAQDQVTLATERLNTAIREHGANSQEAQDAQMRLQVATNNAQRAQDMQYMTMVRMIGVMPTLIMQMISLNAAMGPVGLAMAAIALVGGIAAPLAMGGMGGGTPTLQHGGVVEKTGLAVVHEGEFYSGVGNSPYASAPTLQAGGSVASAGMAVVHEGETYSTAGTAGTTGGDYGSGGSSGVNITGNEFHFHYKTDVASAMAEIGNQARLQLRTMTPQ